MTKRELKTTNHYPTMNDILLNLALIDLNNTSPLSERPRAGTR